MVPWRKTAVTITTCWRPTKSPAFADHVVCFLLSTGFCPTCCWYLESYLPCHSYVTWCHLCRRSSSLGALGWLEKLCFSILGLVIRKRYKFCSSLQKKKKKKAHMLIPASSRQACLQPRIHFRMGLTLFWKTCFQFHPVGWFVCIKTSHHEEIFSSITSLMSKAQSWGIETEKKIWKTNKRTSITQEVTGKSRNIHGCCHW